MNPYNDTGARSASPYDCSGLVTSSLEKVGIGFVLFGGEDDLMPTIADYLRYDLF